MEAKKSDKANLENKKGLFFQIGLSIVLSLLLVAFNWSSRPHEVTFTGQLEEMQVDEEIVPITRQQQVPKIPPPPQIIEQLNIVEDDIIIDEVEFESMEADANMSVDFLSYNNEEEAEDDDIFYMAEEMPKFRGGNENEFRKYIRENLYYPEVARQKGINGTVFIQFTINKIGEVCDVVVIGGVDPALDREAIRIIKSSPKWTPGRQRGRPVNVQYNFSIVFKLD